jgi:DHA2 family multidrug resistance protein-like MFS transporter
MTLLGFSVASALLASSSAIMAAAPKEKAAAAGAIETMAYELGAGLGIALFGLILTRSYTSSIVLPQGIEGAAAEQASSSISEAIKLAQSLPAIPAQSLLEAAKAAFIHSHSTVLATAGVLLLLLAAGIWRSLAKAPELN